MQAASSEKRLLQEHPAEYCGLNMRDAGRSWCQAPTSETFLSPLLSELWVYCSLPSPVTHGLQTDLMGSAVLPCPSLKHQCAAQDLGSAAPGANCCFVLALEICFQICFTPAESTEMLRLCSESPSWAPTVSAVWVGSSGGCRSAEPQQELFCAGVSFQRVRVWFHFLRIFVKSE